jgi:hypothetical protein
VTSPEEIEGGEDGVDDYFGSQGSRRSESGGTRRVSRSDRRLSYNRRVGCIRFENSGCTRLK